MTEDAAPGVAGSILLSLVCLLGVLLNDCCLSLLLPWTSWKPVRELPRPSEVSTSQPCSVATGSRQLLTATTRPSPVNHRPTMADTVDVA